MSIHEEDTMVRATNEDATGCRYSMVTRGYMEDEYVSYFTKANRVLDLRKLPIIHLGTYIRCKSIDHIVEWFIKRTTHHPRKQIVSLGAGFDTRYFRLKVREIILI
jgi:O-methyltransferase involved in polyketide biosynthesis